MPIIAVINWQLISLQIQPRYVPRARDFKFYNVLDNTGITEGNPVFVAEVKTGRRSDELIVVEHVDVEEGQSFMCEAALLQL